MSTSATLTADQDTWRPRFNPWLIAVVVAMAAFMEVLDTSIANVALPYMAGNLGASNDQSTWVLTSYLVSNAIVLPISGWLAGALGRKRFFIICLFIFTTSSLLCGIAPSLGLLLFFRVLQGAGGGGLQPMAQAILADTFPPQQRGLAFALYGITAVTAPTIGPTLGGWITFNYTWRWIFFINLPVGLLTLLLVFRFVEDPPYLARIKAAGVKLDYIGIGLLAIGVGALQVLLDKGQEDDWFGSRFITTLVIMSAVCLIALVIWEWYQKAPVVDVRLFKNFNFASSNLMMFTLGIMLFSSLVLMPLFLQTLMGYTAEVAGLAISAGGLCLLIEMPIMGTLTTKIQARYLIAFGWLCLALAMYYSTKQIDLQIGFSTALWLRVFQVFGMGFLFVPITLVAYIGIAPEKNNAVSGADQFHAQHRQQRGNFDRDHFAGAPVAISPGDSHWQYPSGESSAPGSGGWPLAAPRQFRIKHPHRANDGLCQNLPVDSGAGRCRGLHRHLYGFSHRVGHHVLPRVYPEEERSGRRRACYGGIKKLHFSTAGFSLSVFGAWQSQNQTGCRLSYVETP